VANRHKWVTNARKLPKAVLVIGPIAVLATAAVVASGVASGSPISDSLISSAQSSMTGVTSDRDPESSRSGDRTRAQLLAADMRAGQLKLRHEREAKATEKAIRNADTMWATTDLNVWSESGKDAKRRGLIEAAHKVLVTGREANGRSEIAIDGEARWVTSGYFADEKPVAAAAGLSMAPCPDGSVESGLTSNAVYVYRSVCHAFPQITTYGGWDAHGEHASGKAIDIMTSDVELGNAIADFLQAHAAELNLYDVIWQQHIWTPERSSEGWRYMSSRGSATANHYDHVHVSVN
jgi:hypothetical protein